MENKDRKFIGIFTAISAFVLSLVAIGIYQTALGGGIGGFLLLIVNFLVWILTVIFIFFSIYLSISYFKRGNQNSWFYLIFVFSINGAALIGILFYSGLNDFISQKYKRDVKDRITGVRKKENRELNEKLFGTTPFYQATIIKHKPTKWKIIDGLMDYDSASKTCQEYGFDWALPSREELLSIIPQITESQKDIWKTNTGIKTSDPTAVISLLPFEREGKRNYKNNVVCVGNKIPFNALSGKNWSQIPIYANFFEAKKLCKKLGENWELTSAVDWKEIEPELPNEEIGYAWANNFIAGRWKTPKSIYYYDIHSRKFNTVDYYDGNTRRFLTFCVEK